MAAGLEQAVAFLENARFGAGEIAWLRAEGRFSNAAVAALAGFRFTGDVDALPEGTVFFVNEPVLRVTAPLPEAQLVESRLINLINLQTVCAPAGGWRWHRTLPPSAPMRRRNWHPFRKH